MKYMLNKAESVPVALYNVAHTKVVNGKSIVTYSNYMRLAPDEVYETDDEAMIEWFKAYRRKVKYNSALESTLKANNVPYTVELCRSCGGKVKKINYQVVEVFE